jgi:hypothetical protein
MNNAYVFDVDDTLVTTDARIIVKDPEGNVINKLTPAEYNTYSKQEGESFDFSEFDSHDIFHGTAKPTKYFKVIKTISDAIKQRRSNSFIYVLTARGNKVKDAIHEYLTRRDIEVRPIEVHTIGDRQDMPISELKKDVLKKIRNKHIGKVVFFDDDHKNIMLANDINGIDTRLIRI